MDTIILLVFGCGLAFLIIKGLFGLPKDTGKVHSSPYVPPGNNEPKPSPTKDEEQTSEQTSLAEWKASLQLMAQGMGETIEFTYESRDGGRSRRIIDLYGIFQSPNERIYIAGFCHTDQDDRTFNINNITTMIKHKSKRYEVYEYFEDKYGLDVY